jgi:hypothetical protein
MGSYAGLARQFSKSCLASPVAIELRVEALGSFLAKAGTRLFWGRRSHSIPSLILFAYRHILANLD